MSFCFSKIKHLAVVAPEAAISPLLVARVYSMYTFFYKNKLILTFMVFPDEQLDCTNYI